MHHSILRGQQADLESEEYACGSIIKMRVSEVCVSLRVAIGDKKVGQGHENWWKNLLPCKQRTPSNGRVASAWLLIINAHVKKCMVPYICLIDGKRLTLALGTGSRMSTGHYVSTRPSWF